jgi:hypothetical protein
MVTQTGVVTMAAGPNALSIGQDVASLVTQCNLLLGSSNNVVVFANSNVDVTASNDLLLTARANALVSANSNIQLAAQSDVLLLAKGSVAIGASNDVGVNGGVNLYLAATSNVFVTASNTSLVLAAAQSASLTVLDGGITLLKNAGGAAGAVAVTNLNGTVAVSSSAAASLTSTGSTVTVAGQQGLIFTSQSTVSMTAATDATYGVGASNRHAFQVGGVDIVTISPNQNSNRETEYLVRINADFEIAGITNSVNVLQTDLAVEDRLIRLAFNKDSNMPIDDGVANEGAGIWVDGVPVGKSNDTSGYYEKSMLWHKNTGGVPLIGAAWAGDASGPAASFWELKGGDLRIKKTYDAGLTTVHGAARLTGESVTYGFRVNDWEELELYKITGTGAGQAYSRVAKFGRQVFK